MAYLDHAATTPLRPEALAAMLPVLTGPAGNPSGAHGAARAARRTLDDARDVVAAHTGALPGEVVFTSGGTEADNLAVKGAARAARARGLGDGVVVSAVEHPAVLASADRLAADGFRVARAAVDPDGIVDLDRLAAALDERTVLVSVMAVNNETGAVQPLEEVAAVVRERAPRARLHTDAVQAAPWSDLAAATGVADLVTLSAHKVGGPVGAGALVVRGEVPLERLLDGGGQERGRRAGTQGAAAAAGFAAALAATAATRPEEVRRVGALRARLAAAIATMPGAAVTGDPARTVPGIVHATFAGLDGPTLLALLDRVGVHVSAGASCASGATEPSPVLLEMGRAPAVARSGLRLSLGWTSTGADVDAALDALAPAVARLRDADRLAG